MAKKLDPVIADVLKSYGFGADSAWDCHGTWVVYHRVLEQIAAKAGIAFDPPMPLETNGGAKSVAICVTGRKGDKSEWSIGEAAPGNNKNAYPYAMAEKRAKDRVILKLIGLHGLAYSEDEADDFKAPPQTALPSEIEPSADMQKASKLADLLITALRKARTPRDLTNWAADEAGNIESLPANLCEKVRGAYKEHLSTLKNLETAQ
jgi:hypothetical protein